MGPWLDVVGQVLFQQESIEERLVLLIRQIGQHGRSEELGVLLIEEEAQLVAGIFRVVGPLLGVPQLVPIEDEAELDQLGVAAERREERVDLGQAVVGLELRRSDVGQIELFAFADEADLLLLGEVDLGIQSVGQSQIARAFLDFGQ